METSLYQGWTDAACKLSHLCVDRATMPLLAGELLLHIVEYLIQCTKDRMKHQRVGTFKIDDISYESIKYFAITASSRGY